MAESRYGNGSDPTALNPNTQQSTGSSAQTQSSSSFQGISGADKANLQTLINTLLYGQGTSQGTVYRDAAGNIVDKSEYDNFIRMQQNIQQDTRMNSSQANAAMQQLFNNRITAGTEALDSTTGKPVAGANFSGTTAMQEAAAAKKQVMTDLTKLISQYSPEGASADSALVMQKLLQDSMEANMPAIQRSIENAGTSGSAQSALLSQNLATKSAGEAAQLGLQAKTNYGQISANLANVLGSLANQEDPAIKALLEALKATSTGQSGSSQSSTETRQSGPIGLQGTGAGNGNTIDPSSVFHPGYVAGSQPYPWISADYGR